ncbi:hypothetical protein [Blastopirellula marina]|uniref:Uncharacterized protein n=1 Tax=Blastopirellula marina TaxID=124 RepID=A0A2S8GCF4_9BACT|nr:hypothetical protein [Blastopirellula marina]PQO42146.1 hypothetical protein C5Y93_27760 [Blastopirellula marina]
MTLFNRTAGGLTLALLTAGLAGCQSPGKIDPAPPTMLGASVDELNRSQEVNAEAAQYVVYQHEFQPNFVAGKGEKDAWKLNGYGEDHVKQIASNLLRGDESPVVIERSQTSPKQGTEYEYPVHFNDELDEKRRRCVVASLVALGVNDAESRVVVAPSFSEGLTSGEAAAAYRRGMTTNNRGGSGGYGSFGGGGGFGGGFF